MLESFLTHSALTLGSVAGEPATNNAMYQGSELHHFRAEALRDQGDLFSLLLHQFGHTVMGTPNLGPTVRGGRGGHGVANLWEIHTLLFFSVNFYSIIRSAGNWALSGASARPHASPFSCIHCLIFFVWKHWSFGVCLLLTLTSSLRFDHLWYSIDTKPITLGLVKASFFPTHISSHFHSKTHPQVCATHLLHGSSTCSGLKATLFSLLYKPMVSKYSFSPPALYCYKWCSKMMKTILIKNKSRWLLQLWPFNVFQLHSETCLACLVL
jgi:hypothetical protein